MRGERGKGIGEEEACTDSVQQVLPAIEGEGGSVRMSEDGLGRGVEAVESRIRWAIIGNRPALSLGGTLGEWDVDGRRVWVV